MACACGGGALCPWPWVPPSRGPKPWEGMPDDKTMPLAMWGGILPSNGRVAESNGPPGQRPPDCKESIVSMSIEAVVLSKTTGGGGSLGKAALSRPLLSRALLSRSLRSNGPHGRLPPWAHSSSTSLSRLLMSLSRTLLSLASKEARKRMSFTGDMATSREDAPPPPPPPATP